jgi:hypothetical protein
MEINLLNLRNSINKAYLKVKPNRTQIETFKKNITNLFDQIKESESEEFHKNIISEFLKNTYYSPNNYINTKGRSDLVIHNGKDSKSTVGVLFEAKKPSNKSEMPTCENINSKAFHELILYYLRERITNKNIEVKHLVITNIFEWFIFNSNDFEKLFVEDKSIVKQFTDFEEGRLSGTNTDFFYKNIAEPFVNESESNISVTHFDIRDFETTIKNDNREDDNKLIALYKILSPEHLLKLPFANDSNNLDKTFYNELLHIIGLEETKEGSKKLIGRKIEKKRNPGSLIENSITILKYEDCLSQLPKLSDFRNNKEEQLFNIALELVITWINRILFLKLLEGQLIKYNNGDKTFRFLNVERIHDYDELNKLFFQVLAVKENDRSELIKQKFGNVPYLNSSLFEPSDLEHKTIRINSLENHYKLPSLSGTVLKDKTGRKLTGDIDPLQYLFEFLDSYDFSSEGSEEIQEENKTLINASVLGLIFEKINGYKDGSFFTPGFITMYMCHETIRRAVVQKINEVKGWHCETISDVYNKIEDIKEADCIINSLRICDPAVGSGHFLVSALNEIIAIKSELKILTDREGKKLKEYTIEVINDELIITDEQSKAFQYNPKSIESQRVQEALFQEKQKIIENCLFGVDINPNSVKICRLRLWIELLKNAYYKPNKNFRELETLPNIDINIKCGNSLISRYPLNADIKMALKSSKWNVDNYREAVMTYRNAQSKDEKRSMEQLILKIKNDFEIEVSKSDKQYLKRNKLNGELLSLTSQSSLFELTKSQKEDWNKKVKKLSEEIKKYETEIEQIKSNKIFENAFEWRFEFPEVLNDEGEFVGFDIVIGNPPYIRVQDLNHNIIDYYKQNFYSAYKRLDISILFSELGLNILNNGGYLTFITSNQFFKAEYGRKIRELVFNKLVLNIDFSKVVVFEGLATYVSLLIYHKTKANTTPILFKDVIGIAESHEKQKFLQIDRNILQKDTWEFNLHQSLKNKLFESNPTIKQVGRLTYGIITGHDDAFIFDKDSLAQITSNYDYFFEFIRPQSYKKYEKPKPNQYIFYPYKKDQSIIDEEILQGNKPFYDFLLAKKEILENRQDSRKTIKSKGLSWYSLIRKVDIDYTSSKKILFYDVGAEPNFTLDTTGLLFGGGTTHSLTVNENLFKTEYILGLLNSKLFSWIIKDLCPVKMGDARKYGLSYIERLPVAKSKPEDQLKICSLVSQIYDFPENKGILSKQIDQLVYQIFGLTEEEIRVIENWKYFPNI